MDQPTEDTPLRDHGSFAHPMVGEDEIQGHHTDRWQQQAMYVGLHFPQQSRRRHRRKHRHHRRPEDQKKDAVSQKPAMETVEEGDPERHGGTPPSERVQFLLGRGEEEEDDDIHDIFCEMDELRSVGENGDKEWKETARWIKFEEDVEEGGERWSKPFVATLSLHSLFELRKGIMSGTVMLDLEGSTIQEITDLVLDQMVASRQLDAEKRELVSEVLLSRHRHQHDKKHSESKGLPLIRSLADIGKKNSEKKLENKEGASGGSGDVKDHSEVNKSESMKLSASGAHLTPGSKASSANMNRNEGSAGGDLHETPSQYKFNQHFAKKIPAGAEASNILVGEVDFLTVPIMAFTRLAKADIFGELTEVPVPTRFLFILLGPEGSQKRYHEIGRSIATLMSDEVFHEVAYRARNREDLLAGIDEFLDQVTVLPPGEWDPNIRIEPPKSVPSQAGRKKPADEKSGLPNGLLTKEPEEEEHGDPTLERSGRLFGGLVQDVRRKKSWYLSDFKDAIHIQCVASFFFIYFACLTPIITFGGLLGSATDNNLAAMESLVSGAICGISYHLFAGQPLTIVGSTGPVLVFETIVYNFCFDQGLNFLAFRFWIGIWMALILLFMVAFDLSALVKYITRFTEESFAMLIALIFIVEAFKKLFHILDHHGVDLHPEVEKYCHCLPGNDTAADANGTSPAPWTTTTPMMTSMAGNVTEPDWANIDDDTVCKALGGTLVGSGCHYAADVFFFCCLLFIGTFVLAYGLKFFRNTRFLPTKVRCLISDFAVFLAIVLMVVVDLVVGLDTPKLLVPEQFRPTRSDRGWLVDPFRNPGWTIPAAILPSLLATILIFMDQQITAVIVNRKENKLRKGGGYHLDLLLITVQIVICSVVGTPWFVAATVLSINHVRSLTRESESSAPGERPKFLGVREQRVTGTLVFILVGLSALMAAVLKHIPMAVLYGVFLFMGVSSVKGIQLMQRIMILFMAPKYQPDYMFLRHVPLRRVHLFTLIQAICLAILWGIKTYKKISIIFPLMVLAMCFVRKALDWVFTRHELKWLDDIMPESHKREKEEKKKKMMDEQEDQGEQVIEMTGGTVNIPLKEGKSINIPVDRIIYDPVTRNINVSDEMSKTAIWKQLVVNESNPEVGKDSQLRNRKPGQGAATEEAATAGPVRFHVGGDEEHPTTSRPEIVVDPPSYRETVETEDTKC